jgi:hypothetical protein
MLEGLFDTTTSSGVNADPPHHPRDGTVAATQMHNDKVGVDHGNLTLAAFWLARHPL